MVGVAGLVFFVTVCGVRILMMMIEVGISKLESESVGVL